MTPDGECMNDLMIGTDSAAEELETGGVGKGYSSGNEPSNWARCSQSRITAALFRFEKSSVCLKEVHMLEGGSWDDGKVTARGIASGR